MDKLLISTSRKKRKKDELCEAAHPSVKSSPFYCFDDSIQRRFSESNTETNSGSIFMRLSNNEDSKTFVKPKSSTNSDLDQYLDVYEQSDSDCEEEYILNETVEQQQIPQQAVELPRFDLHIDCPISRENLQMVHQETCQPCITLAKEDIGHEKRKHSTSLEELVTGCDTPFPLSKALMSRKSATLKPSTKPYPCFDREIRAQQIILTQGWSEDSFKRHKRSLKDLDITRDLTNGHPIGKCILNAFRRDAVYFRGDFIGERKGTLLVNSSQCTTPHRKLFSQKIDESVSLWEKTFSKQFGQDRVMYKGWDVTTPFLLVLLYRSAYQGSILIDHFVNSGCSDCLACSFGVQKTMIKLKRHHSIMCESLIESKHDVSSLMKKVSTDHECEQLKLLYHHCNESDYEYPYIEFPHLVQVGLQFRYPKTTKIRHIIYMQIPPYFFAVSADCCILESYAELMPHFPNVIKEIHKELTLQREFFFQQRPDLREMENLAMVYPYRYYPDGRHCECRFLKVNIKADGG